MQFLAVMDNRLYHSYQRINIEDSVKKLNIKFLTFRDKLLPGEKESWKLQIKSTSGEQVSAELLADLYDASLNDIAPEQYWNTQFGYTPVQPEYFAWTNDEFVKPDETGAFEEDYTDYDLTEREYEALNLFGYDYYGDENTSYNEYLQEVEDRKKTAKSDAGLLKQYTKNAALVKNGFDVSGKVIRAGGAEGLPGVRISIKGPTIYTYSNSAGYFRIKVPASGILVFSRKYYSTKQIKAKPGNAQLIALYKSYGSMKKMSAKMAGSRGKILSMVSTFRSARRC